MLRPWTGPLTVEGIQTGDGRIMTAGAFTWAPLPLPLTYVPDASMHTELSFSSPQVGVITSIERDAAGLIQGRGMIDTDMDPAAAELVRRMDTGVAPHGNAQYVSIDPDNWAVQVVATDDAAAEDMLLVASAGHVPPGVTWVNMPHPRDLLRSMVAAAGDPDVPDATVLFEDNVDSILARFTALRIRGATLVNIPAFDEAAITLDPEPLPASSVVIPSSQTVAAPATTTITAASPTVVMTDSTSTVVAHGAPPLSRGLLVPDAPAAEVFNEPGPPDGSLNIDEYRTYGYIALWDSCHNSLSPCTPPPREPDYSLFHHGQVVCEDGTQVATGAFTWGIPHADLDDDMLAACTHYANAAYGFADVAVGANEHGIWHAGALRPASRTTPPLTSDDARVLRALSMSGDWRYDYASRQLRLIAGLAVNHPGFFVPRLNAVTAAARRAVHVLAPDTEIRMAADGTHPLSLVAAGMTVPSTHTDTAPCGCHDEQSMANRLARIEAQTAAIDMRTRHLIRDAAKAQLARIRD